MELATRFIPDFQSHSSDPLALFGLIMLVIIFAAVAFITHDQRKTQGRTKIVVLKRMTCPVCRGTTKMPDQTHDSADIQFVACGRCSGVGTILII